MIQTWVHFGVKQTNLEKKYPAHRRKKEKKKLNNKFVSCHLTTSLCSFSRYESPRRFGDAAAGGLVIDRVKKSNKKLQKTKKTIVTSYLSNLGRPSIPLRFRVTRRGGRGGGVTDIHPNIATYWLGFSHIILFYIDFV